MENSLCGSQSVMIGIVFEKFHDIQPALISISFSFEEEDDGRCRMTEPSFTRLKRSK
jgi:hypothetical protein